MSTSDGQITYSFPIGGKEFAENAKWVARSIKKHCSDPHIVVGIRPEEREEISDSVLEEVKDIVDDFIEIERPREEYPISIKIENLVRAAKISDRDFIVHLDSDVLVMSDLTKLIPETRNQGWMKVKEVDFGAQYWGGTESEKDWKYLFDEIGEEYPGRIFNSTIDDRDIPPFFNAGFVMAPNTDFANDWLEMTKLVWDNFETPYSDQIALGLLSMRYDRKVLTNKNSLNLPGSLYVPTKIDVLRYEEIYHLLRLSNPLVIKKVLDLGLNPYSYFNMIEIPKKIQQSLNMYRHLNNILQVR